MKEYLYNYFSAQAGTLSMENVLINFAVALLLGGAIYVSYRFSHSGAVYSARFNVSLVMLTLITSLVMTVIGNNVALSLGMVGALSIVRFRTAIKDSRDTAYIFWCIAVGICCGVSEYIIASLGSGIIFLFLLAFGHISANDRYLLVIRSSAGCEDNIEKAVLVYFGGAARMRVKNTTKETAEYIYELSERIMRKAQKRGGSINERLYSIEGIQSVNLVCQNDEINR